MQKTNNKASILIWSIFLSLVVSLSFVFVSTKINQNLALNTYLNDFFSNDNKTTELVKNNSLGDIGDNSKLLLETNSISLSNGESQIFSFSGSSDFTGSITIKEGGPLYFETISYSGSLNNLELTTSTGIISDNKSFIFTGVLDLQYKKTDLIVKNLGANLIFKLETNTEILTSGTIKKYKITKNIGGKDVEKNVIEN
ncbi:hypothetical protein EOM39_00750 [Candidatus Gracilibacteria bacterium]|nr:hypothetical protein [Candidatus Gracilibacteria bacterium]